VFVNFERDGRREALKIRFSVYKKREVLIRKSFNEVCSWKKGLSILLKRWRLA
jgi:hypothetical protein